jgi:hypothetical protein
VGRRLVATVPPRPKYIYSAAPSPRLPAPAAAAPSTGIQQRRQLQAASHVPPRYLRDLNVFAAVGSGGGLCEDDLRSQPGAGVPPDMQCTSDIDAMAGGFVARPSSGRRAPARAHIEVLFVKVHVFILLLFASLPDCGQNQTAAYVSDEQQSLSDF